MTEDVERSEWVGILGGGQLGRMLTLAASRLGVRTHVYAPDEDPVAGMVAARQTCAGYEDTDALAAFAASVDVVTFEFENVPLIAVEELSRVRPVLPGARALEVSQDRATEKQFFVDLGLLTAPFRSVADLDDLRGALDQIGVPAILKTRRFGYDGKGQARIRSDEDAHEAWEAIGRAPAILEGFVGFDREVSVIAARSVGGDVVCFDPGENVHRDGILRTTTVPARIPAPLVERATRIATDIADALDYVGVLGVELFVAGDDLVVNEMAPRVHNSGHWTQNGCVVDQFEQHIRAILGRPLGDGRRHADVVMTNLIGDDVRQLDSWWSDPAAALHLYGKHPVAPGRKMGHVNRIARIA